MPTIVGMDAPTGDPLRGLNRPFATVTPTLDGDVLAVLATHHAAFTTGQIHRVLNRFSEEGIRKVLSRLVRQGVVLLERVGQAYAYRLNTAHLAAEPIVALAKLFNKFLTRLEEQLSGWDHPPAYAAVFGSAVRGTMTAESDVDLFLVRETTRPRPSGKFKSTSWPLLSLPGPVTTPVLSSTQSPSCALLGRSRWCGKWLNMGSPWPDRVPGCLSRLGRSGIRVCSRCLNEQGRARKTVRLGRLKKATQFLDAAIVIDDEMSDAAVTLLVNAGIAAADVICGVGELVQRVDDENIVLHWPLPTRQQRSIVTGIPVRNVSPELAQRYEDEGWWTRDTLGDLLARGPARPRRDVPGALGGAALAGTFADVEPLARRLAAGLRARGVGPGDVVAFQLPNWMEAAASFWASAFLGAVVVPIVHFYGRKELSHILATARPKVFITAEQFGRMTYHEVCADVPIVGVVGPGLRRPAGRRADDGHAGHRPARAGADRLHLGHHQRPQGRRAQPSDARLRNPPAVADTRPTAAGSSPRRPSGTSSACSARF